MLTKPCKIFLVKTTFCFFHDRYHSVNSILMVTPGVQLLLIIINFFKIWNFTQRRAGKHNSSVSDECQSTLLSHLVSVLLILTGYQYYCFYDFLSCLFYSSLSLFSVISCLSGYRVRISCLYFLAA